MFPARSDGSDLTKVHEGERLSQPDAGGMIEKMMFPLGLEEKNSY